MPIIDIKLSPGRSAERLHVLIAEVTNATSRALEIPVEKVRVMLHEVPDTHWATGGRTIAQEKIDHA